MNKRQKASYNIKATKNMHFEQWSNRINQQNNNINNNNGSMPIDQCKFNVKIDLK